MKTWKKALALVLALSMIIPGVYLGGNGSKEVQAETDEEVSTVTAKDYAEAWKKSEVENYIGISAPTPKNTSKTGYLFAGWFKTEKCTLDGGITKLDDIEDGSTVWAKFVPAGLLNVKAQSTPEIENGDDVMRFVSSVDTLNYSKVGFEVTYPIAMEEDTEDGNQDGFVTKSNISDTVFKRIQSENDNIKYEFDPKVVDVESDYFITATLDINNKPFDGLVGTNYTVKAFWQTFDGVRVRGESRCVSVEDCRATDTINLTFTATGIDINTKLSVKECSTDRIEVNGVTIIAVDGNTVHVRVTLKNKTADDQTSSKAKLPSATKFTFKVEGGEDEVGSAIFRNLYTQYGAAEVADRTWYDVYKAEGEKEFTIATDADLYGFAVASANNNYANDTIYLVADIEANKGYASASKWDKTLAANGKTSISDGTEHTWTTIGTNSSADKRFAGTFDGQGHTISGIYLEGTMTYTAFFGAVGDAGVVQNFKLKNSYFFYDKSNNATVATASIAGGFRGTMREVYSDAIVKTGGKEDGGLVGWLGGTAEISNCWFDGELHLTETNGYQAGGIAGTVWSGPVTVSHCLNTGKITWVRTTGDIQVGGIVGVPFKPITMEDNLVACTFEGTDTRVVGTVIGNGSTGELTISETYVVKGNISPTIEKGGVIKKQNIITLPEEMLTGYSAYQWTGLDFKNYWAVDEQGTPILKSFAEDIPSLDDYTNMADLSWYDESVTTPYQISNAKQLYGLYVMSTVTDFTGKTIELTDDISLNDTSNLINWKTEAPKNEWYPIGSAKPFNGIFDGKGNTISGLYLNATAAFAGLFGRTAANSRITNLRLTDSYVYSEYNTVGSIVGEMNGDIQAVYSNATVEGLGTYTGGLVGRTMAKNQTISNCWYDGKLASLNTTLTYSIGVGGITGYIGDTGTTIENCLFTGNITIAHTNNNLYIGIGGIAGSDNTNHGAGVDKIDIKNCLSAGKIQKAVNSDRHGGAVIGLIRKGRVTFTDTFATNECASADAAIAYGDGVIAGKAPEKKAAKEFHGADGVALLGSEWTAVGGHVPVPKEFEDMITFDTNWYDDKKDEFIIESPEQLLGFAVLVNNGYDFADMTVTLKNDIKLNDGNAEDWAEGKKIPSVLWTPIGTEDAAFAGTFDGGDNTISGLYMAVDTPYSGLFGYTSGATIKNVRLENSYLESDVNGNVRTYMGSAVTNPAYMGSIIGYGSGAIENVYSNAILMSTGNYVGGLVGTAGGALDITGSWYAGQANVYEKSTGSGYAAYFGGLIGYILSGTTTIDNSLFSGTMYLDFATEYEGQRNASIRTGGICGNDKGILILQNSVNAGTITMYSHKNLADDGNVALVNCGKVVGAIENSDTTIEDVYNATTMKYQQEGKTNWIEVTRNHMPEKAPDGVVIDDIALDALRSASKEELSKLTDGWVKKAGELPVPSAFQDITQ